jgi:hypothetical protein
MAADTPRFDYNPVTLICKGLLIEESRTNIWLNSEDFSVWPTNANVTVGTNAISSPANTLTADKIKETAVSGQHYIGYNSSTATVSAIHTFSFYAKADERNVVFAQILDGGAASNGFGVSFQMSGVGAVSIASVYGAGVFGAASITAVGDGWYRCTVTGTTNGSGTTIRANVYLKAAFAGGVSYLGVLDYGLYIWGAQLEAGAFATSYIPTTTTALTRNADVATMTGTNFSDWFNASEGAMVCTWSEIKPGNYNNTTAALSFTDATNGSLAGNKLAIYSFSNAVRYQQTRVAGTVVSNVTSGSAIASNVFATTSFAFKLNSYATSTNGAAVGSDNLGTLPTVDRAYIGRLDGGSNYLNGIVQSIYCYPQRLLNAEVQAFSKKG